MNPLIAALFGQNQGLDITGAVKQQGQNQLNSIDAFGGLMQQAPASKIAQSGNNRPRWGGGLDGLYAANPQMRPGEYDPMGVQAERRRQIQYGTQDTQDRNRLLQEQLWGNFLGQTNDMMGGQGQGPAQIGAAPVQENNSPQQGGFGQLQGQMDQLMKMLNPALNSMDGGQVSAEGGWTMAGGSQQQPQAQQGPMFGPGLPGAVAPQQQGPMPDPYAGRPQDPGIVAAFAGQRNVSSPQRDPRFSFPPVQDVALAPNWNGVQRNVEPHQSFDQRGSVPFGDMGFESNALDPQIPGNLVPRVQPNLLAEMFYDQNVVPYPAQGAPKGVIPGAIDQGGVNFNATMDRGKNGLLDLFHYLFQNNQTARPR